MNSINIKCILNIIKWYTYSCELMKSKDLSNIFFFCRLHERNWTNKQLCKLTKLICNYQNKLQDDNVWRDCTWTNPWTLIWYCVAALGSCVFFLVCYSRLTSLTSYLIYVSTLWFDKRQYTVVTERSGWFYLHWTRTWDSSAVWPDLSPTWVALNTALSPTFTNCGRGFKLKSRIFELDYI